MRTEQENWVRDEPKVWGYDGKTVYIEGRGKFTMKVSKSNSKGETKLGFVQVLITPMEIAMKVAQS